MTSVDENYLVADLQDFTATLVRKLEDAFQRPLDVESQVGKLDEEIAEFVDSDYALEELADIVVVCMTMTNVLGSSVQELMAAVWAKAYRNTQRDWHVPGGTDVARHVGEG